MPETPHADPSEVFRRLLLAQNTGEIGDLAEANIGEWPSTGLLTKLDYISIEVMDGDQNYFEQTAYVDVDVFSRTRAKAKSLSAAISLLMSRYPHSVPLDSRTVTIDRAVCVQIPRTAEWEDTNIRRQSARYEISIRR